MMFRKEKLAMQGCTLTWTFSYIYINSQISLTHNTQI